MRNRKDLYEDFRLLLRETRQTYGLTQADVAKALKVPQSAISKMESGERRIDVAEMLIVLEALGAEPNKFLKELLKRTSWAAFAC